MEYLTLIGGLITLVVSGNFLVKGGVGLAEHFKISKLVVGVTVVSFGTSAPELVVSLKAALSGHPDFSIGNVVGSNIANIALVLAITAIILPLVVNKNSIKFDWPFMMIISLLFYFFIINENGFSIDGGNIVKRWEGIVMVSLLIFYIVFSIRKSRKEQALDPAETSKPKLSIWLAGVMVVASCVGLVFGADWLVKGATKIALDFGVDDRVISVTVVAFGTSVPELVTSVMAAIKKEMDISVGNIIGSNIFNILAILGITSIVQEIPVNPSTARFDFLWVFGIGLLLIVCMIPLKKPKIRRMGGFILLASYIAYIYLVMLGNTEV